MDVPPPRERAVPEQFRSLAAEIELLLHVQKEIGVRLCPYFRPDPSAEAGNETSEPCPPMAPAAFELRNAAKIVYKIRTDFQHMLDLLEV